jgi:hypothetical protein
MYELLMARLIRSGEAFATPTHTKVEERATAATPRDTIPTIPMSFIERWNLELSFKRTTVSIISRTPQKTEMILRA